MSKLTVRVGKTVAVPGYQSIRFDVEIEHDLPPEMDAQSLIVRMREAIECDVDENIADMKANFQRRVEEYDKAHRRASTEDLDFG